MADISDNINNINNARYGKDVRNSIVAAFQALNTDVESATTKNISDKVDAKLRTTEVTNTIKDKVATTFTTKLNDGDFDSDLTNRLSTILESTNFENDTLKPRVTNFLNTSTVVSNEISEKVDTIVTNKVNLETAESIVNGLVEDKLGSETATNLIKGTITNFLNTTEYGTTISNKVEGAIVTGMNRIWHDQLLFGPEYNQKTLTNMVNERVNAKIDDRSTVLLLQNVIKDANNGFKQFILDHLNGDIEDWYNALFYASKNHRNIYRGKNLGTEITDAQWNAIDSGDFTDMYIGDYWVLNGHKYYIADIDYWLDRKALRDNTSPSNGLAQHHLVMIPELIFGSISMNSTASVGNGYAYISGFTQVGNATVSFLADIFGSHLLPVRYRHLGVDTETGVPVYQLAVLSNRKAELLNEQMVFGHPINSIQNSGTNAYRGTTQQIHQQLAIFALNPHFIFEILSSKVDANSAFKIWLTDVASSENFAAIHSEGLADVLTAREMGEILPSFVIGKVIEG